MMSGNFKYGFSVSGSCDVGLMRLSNQDEVVIEEKLGFFAVSDGMGGLFGGGETSKMIAKAFPGLISEAYDELIKAITPEHAASLLAERVKIFSDSINERLNIGLKPIYGATFSGVWLVDEYAVFVNLGDSRGYYLGYYKKQLEQITTDHNVAAVLVANGELTAREAKDHPSSSSLTRFVGMQRPATPDTFIQKVKPGDRILLCSDGLYGMVDEPELVSILRADKNPDMVVQKLIKAANKAGGRDNISAVYIRILK